MTLQNKSVEADGAEVAGGWLKVDPNISGGQPSGGDGGRGGFGGGGRGRGRGGFGGRGGRDGEPIETKIVMQISCQSKHF